MARTKKPKPRKILNQTSHPIQVGRHFPMRMKCIGGPMNGKFLSIEPSRRTYSVAKHSKLPSYYGGMDSVLPAAESVITRYDYIVKHIPDHSPDCPMGIYYLGPADTTVAQDLIQKFYGKY